MNKMTDILPDNELEREAFLHEIKRIAQLRSQQCAICRQIDDFIDTLVSERIKEETAQGEAVFYMGVHSIERTDAGEPKYKKETVFNHSQMKEALDIMRGLEHLHKVLMNKDKAKGLLKEAVRLNIAL